MYNSDMYADISVVGFNQIKNQRFTYLSGKHKPRIGSIVVVPFGSRASLGIVRRLHDSKPRIAGKLVAIQRVLPHQPLPRHLLTLADWMVDYYLAPSSTVWKTLLPKNPQTNPRPTKATTGVKTHKLVPLTSAQKKALHKISQSTKPILLEGVMGSGKTELYFHLIQKQLKQKKSALLLMPEIFLTTQMIERAKKYFGEQLLVTHSELTPAQRRVVWDKCSLSHPVVILGARSAIFSPLHNLGIIIIDECHEPSYKQNTSPRYLTEYVAGKLAQLTSSKLVMGSATPSITTRYLADVGKIQHVILPERAVSAPHPSIATIDMANTQSRISEKLLSLIKQNQSKKNLSLLYLNRRGTAPVFMCQDCGHVLQCPRCESGLHLHADTMQLRCHICNYSSTPPAICPNCGKNQLRGIGVGTKAIESELKKLLPGIKIARIDRDNATPQYLQSTIQDICNQQVDVLIGTQMVGRGIDFEHLSLVGIISADYDLSVIDYNSRERAFQLISQSAGRAGRRDTRGKVLIQTKNPRNTFFQYIINNDYEGFYRDELSLRKKYSYPPFTYLLKLECGFANPQLGEHRCIQLIKQIIDIPGLDPLGPAPANPSVIKGKYYWQIIIKSKSRKKLVELATNLKAYWKINLDPFGMI